MNAFYLTDFVSIDLYHLLIDVTDMVSLKVVSLEIKEPIWLMQSLLKREVRVKVVLSTTHLYYICFLVW